MRKLQFMCGARIGGKSCLALPEAHNIRDKFVVSRSNGELPQHKFIAVESNGGKRNASEV